MRRIFHEVASRCVREDGGEVTLCNSDADEIYRHLDEHGVIDKDSAGGATTKKRTKRYEKTKRGARRVLELHGKTEEVAAGLLRDCVRESKQKGCKEILVIHGRGLHSDPREGAVLKKLVRAMLEHELRGEVRSFGAAIRRDGGEGATVVRLV